MQIDAPDALRGRKTSLQRTLWAPDQVKSALVVPMGPFQRSSGAQKAARKRTAYSTSLPEDSQSRLRSAVDFEVAADGQGGQRVGVADVDVGEHEQTDQHWLAFDDLLQDRSVDGAGSLESADDQGGHLRCVGQLQKRGQVAAKLDRVTTRSDVAGSLAALLVDCVALTQADAAGLLVSVPDDGLALLSSTSHTTSVLEPFELQHGHGPCIQAIHDNVFLTTSTPELADQWAPVGRAIVDAGYGAVHAFPLRWQDGAIGALNLFAVDAQHLDTDTQQLGQAFANMAVAVLAHPQVAAWGSVHQQIIDVLAERATIEQAKGVLAVQRDITLPDAYDLLVGTAVERNMSLSDYAAQVLAHVRSGPR